MPKRSSSRVLRAAVVVEDKLCGELHQTAPGSVSVGWALNNELVVHDAVDRRRDLRKVATPLWIAGLVLMLFGVALFAPEYVAHYKASKTERVASERCNCLQDPLIRMSMTEREAMEEGASIPWRPECEDARSEGVLEPRAEKLAEYCKPADFQAAYGQVESSGTFDRGMLGVALLFLGLAPLMAGISSARDPRLKRKRTPKRSRQAPKSVTLFEYQKGRYYLNLPKTARGKVTLAKGKRAYSVKQLRKKQGSDRVRVGLRPTAKGKIMLGDSIVLFQFARPKKPEIDPRIKPAGLAAIPATAAIGMMLLGAAMLAVLLLVLGPIGVVAGLAVTAAVMAVRQRSKEPLFALCLLATVLTLGGFGMYLSYLVEPTVEVEVDERMAQIMGVTYEQEDEPEPEPEEEEEEPKEEELKQPEEKKQKKKQVEPDKVVKTKPKKYSDEAVKKARGVGVARVLGTYGGPGEGTVFDVIESTENNLDDLFAKGMGRVVDADGNEVSDFVAGGEGISASGAMVGTEGLKTTDEQPAVAKKKKKERKVKGKVKSSTSEVYGDVDKRLVTATIRRRMGALQSCYEKSLRSNAGLKGKISFTITISTTGRVVKVSVEQDTLGDSVTLSCCKSKIKGWRFPIEGAEDQSEVTFSVVFSQAS